MQNKRKKLEKRVEEEQRKLLKLQKNRKTARPIKLKKPQKDISDKLKVKSKIKETKKENFQKNLDYHRFLEQQQQKLDYASMFSYFGNGVKKREYAYSGEDSSMLEALNRKYETLNWGEIKIVTDEDKVNSMMGLVRDFEQNDRRDAYRWWKAFNKGLGEYLFEVSMT